MGNFKPKFRKLRQVGIDAALGPTPWSNTWADDIGNGIRRSKLGTPIAAPHIHRTMGETLGRENKLGRLSRREWAVLKVLIRCSRATIPACQLMDQSLNREGSQGVEHLYKHIGALRKKSELDPRTLGASF